MKTITLLTPLPYVSYCHYSNAASQGSLICQSKMWPRAVMDAGSKRIFSSFEYEDYNDPYGSGTIIRGGFRYGDEKYSAQIPDNAEVASAYSDRMQTWDAKRYDRACQIAGGYEQIWAYKLPSLGEKKLLEFAAVALNLEDKEVLSARVTHHFNVTTGYSCPTVEAIYLDGGE